jgi:glycerol-3-phosphate dehydrogenase
METTDFFLPRNQVLNMFKMFVCDPVSFPCLGDMVGITIYSMLKNIYAIKGNQDPQ